MTLMEIYADAHGKGRLQVLLSTATVAVFLSGCGGGVSQPAPEALQPKQASLLAALPLPLDSPNDLGGLDAAQVNYSNQSLYNGTGPRPGPDILYAPAPRAPQLENTGIWKAEPILVSGVNAYRRGEFLYQDFLYDDRGAKGQANYDNGAGGYAYPTDPEYADNAADIVELRIKTQPAATAFRLTLNTLINPDKVAFTIALGNSSMPRALPFGANVKAPAEYFLTVHGTQAVLTVAETGVAVTPSPTVTVDLERRQFEVMLPRDAWNPGTGVVRVAAGAGLWDATTGRYLVPAATATANVPGGANGAAPAALFNVAFRNAEPFLNFRDSLQAAALANGDISEFFANVDFAKLSANVTDEMTGQPNGVPLSGPISRIYASRFETRQGVDRGATCTGSECIGMYRGRLQPYILRIPSKPAPASGYGLTLLLHSHQNTYLQYASLNHSRQLAERGQGHLVATPEGRGPDNWYVDQGGADTFEMWADIARHYPLNPSMAHITGYSMGGYGTFRLVTQFPDLFARAHTVVGPNVRGLGLPRILQDPKDSTSVLDLMPTLRNVPIMIWSEVADELVNYLGQKELADRLDSLNYRYRFDSFAPGEHMTLALHDNFELSANFLGDTLVDRNPARVTYVVNPLGDAPASLLVANHVYWLSGITVRDNTTQIRGSVEIGRAHV